MVTVGTEVYTSNPLQTSSDALKRVPKDQNLFVRGFGGEIPGLLLGRHVRGRMWPNGFQGRERKPVHILTMPPDSNPQGSMAFKAILFLSSRAAVPVFLGSAIASKPKKRLPRMTKEGSLSLTSMREQD